jgi:hypothetical protein
MPGKKWIRFWLPKVGADWYLIPMQSESLLTVVGVQFEKSALYISLDDRYHPRYQLFLMHKWHKEGYNMIKSKDEVPKRQAFLLATRKQ